MLLVFSICLLYVSSSAQNSIYPRFCQIDGKCCFLTQTGTISVAIDTTVPKSFIRYLDFAYTSTPLRIIFVQKYIQIYRQAQVDSSTNSLGFNGKEFVSSISTKVQVTSITGITKLIADFSFMINNQNSLTFYKLSYVPTSNANKITLTPSNMPYTVNSVLHGAAFLTWFRCTLGSDFGITLQNLIYPATQNNVVAYPKITVNNPYAVSINQLTIFVLLFNKTKFSTSQDLNMYVEYYFTASDCSLITNADFNLQLDNLNYIFGTRLPGSTLYGSQGLLFQISQGRTYSMGYQLAENNTLIVSALSGHTLVDSNFSVTGYYANLFAIFQSYCTGGLVLNADRTTCVTSCYQNQYVKCSYCLPCYYSCGSCTGGQSNQCITCAPNRIRVGTNCPFCDLGSVLVGNQCLSCRIQCRTCLATLSDCLSCYDRYTFFLSTCLNCDPSCLKCSVSENSAKCTACDKSQYLQLKNGSCLCLANYFNLNQKCLPCSSLCATCLLSLNNCISCPEGWNLTNADSQTGYRSCHFCNASNNFEFSTKTNGCFCKLNYSLFDGECLYFGTQLTNQQKTRFQRLSGLASQAKLAQNAAVTLSLALGANNLLLGFVIDSLMLRMHLLARVPFHYELRLFLMALNTQSPLPLFERADRLFSKLTDPGEDYHQPEQNLFVQTEFGNGRFLFSNLFLAIQNWLSFAASVLLLLSLMLLSKLCICCFSNCGKAESLFKIFIIRIRKLPLQSFVIYTQGLLGLVNIALVQITTSVFWFSVYFAASYLTALFILVLVVVLNARIFISVWNKPPTKSWLSGYLLYFKPHYKQFRSFQTTLFFTLGLRLLFLPCFLHFLPHPTAQMVTLILYNIITASQVYYCRRALRSWKLNFVVAILFALFQLTLLLGNSLYSYYISRKVLSLIGICVASLILAADLLTALIQLKQGMNELVRIIKRVCKSSAVHEDRRIKNNFNRFKKRFYA